MTDQGERELRDAVIDALGVEVVPVAMLRERLGSPWSAPHDGRDELDRLLQLDTTFTSLKDGVAFLPAALDGTTWTAWVDPGDAARGFLRTFPSLTALAWWLIGADVELLDAAGSPLGVLQTDGWMLDGRDTDVVLGPTGWLDGLHGSWATFEVVGRAIRMSSMDVPPVPTPAQVAAVRAGFERDVEHRAETDRLFRRDPPPPDGRYTTGDGAIHEALLWDLAAFHDGAVAPLTVIYAAAGLVERNGTIADETFDWDALGAWRTRQRFLLSHGLDPERADQAHALLAAFEAWAAGDGESSTPPTTADALDDGAVANAVWTDLEQMGADADQLVAFGGSLTFTDPGSIGAVWARARALDRAGDAVAAATALEAAVDRARRHWPALIDLAGLRADGGDAIGALQLLDLAGIGPADEHGHSDHDHDHSDHDHDHERSDPEQLWDEVEPYATHRPRATARRNDPCPCGSGRKYKACHLGRETHTLEDRARWLYLKADRFLRARYPDVVVELTGDIVDEYEQPAVFDALVESTLVSDIVLHEDGVFAEFLAARDGLLPADEALLGAQWALADRGVFEVVEVQRDALELRDVTTGEQIIVTNIDLGEDTRPGILVVGRPLPIGDSHRAFGGLMPFSPRYLDHLLAAIDTHGSDELAEVIAAILAPPTVTNTDGQDLVAHVITWSVPDPAVVGGALVSAGLRDDGDGRWTLVRQTRSQDGTTVATVRLDGDRLTGDVNATDRAEELQQLVATALPGAELLDIDARPFRLPAGARSDEPDEPIDPVDPALRAALLEHMAAMEERWLDESIPALGGRTPREAADDPVGREEVIRLLASFPPPPEGGTITAMDPERLRALLGL